MKKDFRAKSNGIGPYPLNLLIAVKLTIVLTVVFALQATAGALAQKIDLEVSNQSLVSVLHQLRKQSGYAFLYNEKDLARAMPVTLRVKNKDLKEVLPLVFQGQPLTYGMKGRVISVIAKPRRPVIQRSVTGKVTDAFDDTPIAGVSISIAGTAGGTKTDTAGVYELVANEGDSLVFSSVGYLTQKIAVGDVRIINVRLSQDTESLEEAVVVAFGKQAKESVVSSITTINVKDLRTPSSNLTTALAGRLAGMVAYQSTGAPGEEDAQFFVRSVTSFGSGLTAPLILIDNIEVTSRDLARLNPDDIASFSILKDASATALYGARGANGVVLVTTKEGEVGKVKTSFRYETSLSTPTAKVDIADPITFMEYSNVASMTRHGQLTYPQSKIEFTKDPNRNQYVYPAVDWKDMLTRNHSLNQRANINLTGGGNAAQYYLAGSFSHDNGILQVDRANPFNTNIDLKKYSVRSNVNLNLTKSLEAKVRVSANFDDYSGPIGESGSGGAYTYGKTLLANPVLFPAYYAPDDATQYVDRILFGNYTGDDYGVGSPQYINPYADVMRGYEDVRNNTFLAQLELHQDLGMLTEGLKARFIGSVTRYSGFSIQRSYKPYYYQYIKGTHDPGAAFPYELAALNPEDGSDHIDYTAGNKFVQARYYAEGAMLYNRRYHQRHDVGGLLVGSVKETMDGSPSNLDSSLPSRNVALAGRFTYGLDQKYFVEFNFGLNGSERFDPRFRWGFFPSIGVGWQLSKEKFWAGLEDAIPLLKIRGTYGLVGNDVIVSQQDRFFFTSNINLNGPNAGFFGNDPEATFSRPTIQMLRYANPHITWEVSYKTNLGLELGLFNNDLSLIAEVYHENRTNIVQVRQDIPSIVGLTAGVRTNYGEAVGRGLDLTLNYNKAFANSMWYIIRGNYTYGTAKITVYDELDYSDVAPWRSVVGQKVGQSRGYVAERLFIDDNEVSNSPMQQVNSAGGEYQAGDIKYRDINGDGVINEFDIVPMGYPTNPEIQYGLGASFGYKNFDISAFVQGASRFSFFLDAESMAPFVEVTSGGQRGNRAMLNFISESLWTETNRDVYAAWPRLSPDVAGAAIGNNNNFVKSNYWMRTAGYLRLKSVEAGYSLPDVKGVSCRIYASGTNLLTLSDFDLWDPEMRGNGLAYPLQKVFNLGVQINF
ncbi:TonB-dependent receptor [Parapedobacter sp.]